MATTRKTSTKSSSKKSSTKTAAKSSKTAKRGTARKTSKRTLIEPHKGDRRYVRRDKKGEFKSEVNVGRSLAADRRTKSTTKAAKGQGDRGDASGGGIVASVKKTVRKVLKKF
ncbi:MAG: hypothetical protein M3Z64_02940 [Verrucomicrobiota bacterium]|nr:hypothetical protein [Verrucomicrobiota bacterium]